MPAVGQPLQLRIDGLKQLDRALGKADKGLRTNLRASLKELAGEVAVEAQSIVTAKGLVQTGDLRRSIKPYALTGRAGVRANAAHRGFGYPFRLEYEGRIGRWGYGPRAYLNPAVENKEPELRRGIERVLDAMNRDFNL